MPHLGAGAGGDPCEAGAVAVGVDGAVPRGVERRVDVLHVHQRVQLLRLLRTQHVGLDAIHLT